MKSFLFAVVFALGFSQAYAVPSLGQIVGEASLNGIVDDASELFKITDLDAGVDDTDLLITFRYAGGTNRVFVYPDSTPTLQLTVFDAVAPVLSTATVSYNLVSDELSIGANSIGLGGFGGFGFGIEHSDGNQYFSQTALNADGFDHFLTFDVGGIVSGGINTFGNYHIAVEDLPFGGDKDFNDVGFVATDISPVAAPGVLALFGIGLLGMARAWRT